MGKLTITNQVTGARCSIDQRGSVRPKAVWPDSQYDLLSPSYMDQLNKDLAARLEKLLVETPMDETREYNNEKHKLDRL